MLRFVLLLTALLASCQKDETISGFVGADGVFRLVELDGRAFGPRATIAFPEPGKIRGDGPCNNYSAPQTVPYPWVRIGAIAATRRACPDLEAESAFFADLQAMTLAEVSGDVLILSNDTGRRMVFRAQAPVSD